MKRILQRCAAIVLALSVMAGTALAQQPSVPVSAENKVVMEEHVLDLESIANDRDIGGYITQDGRRVKRDVLFCSGQLTAMSPEELEKLRDQYGVATVIDLRTNDEVAQGPDPVMEGIAYHHINVMDGLETAQTQAAIVTIHEISRTSPGRAYVETVRLGALSDDMYLKFINSEKSAQAYRRFFDVLLGCENGGVLWHCTGGKDRTGLASVMVLSVLGVDEKTVMADFLMTNEINRGKIAYIVDDAQKYTDDPQELRAVELLAGVSQEHMEKVFAAAREESGSMAAFVQERIGLTDAEIERLKEMYLE